MGIQAWCVHAIPHAIRDMQHALVYNITSYMRAAFVNMRRCSSAIRYHSVILAPSLASESAYLGLYADPQPENCPFGRQPLKWPFRVEKRPLTPKRGFPVQSNLFAVI